MSVSEMPSLGFITFLLGGLGEAKVVSGDIIDVLPGGYLIRFVGELGLMCKPLRLDDPRIVEASVRHQPKPQPKVIRLPRAALRQTA